MPVLLIVAIIELLLCEEYCITPVRNVITFNVRNTPMKSALLAEAYTARNWGNQNAHSAVGDSKSPHWRVEGAGSVDLFYSWRPERKSKLPWGTQEASGRTGAETSPLTLGPVFCLLCPEARGMPGLRKLSPFPLRLKPLHSEEATFHDRPDFSPVPWGNLFD